MLLVIDENSADTRLDVFLSELYDGISRSKIQSAIKSGKVTVNGEVKKPSYTLKLDDKVEFENLVEDKVIEIKPQNIPLEIVWEDENMAVVNKPSGMLTHPTFIETENTLVNALLYKYGDNLSDTNGAFRRGIVHRLDRNTSGLLMIPKNNKTHEYLANLIKDHKITKKYHAVLKGFYPYENDVISEPIGRNNLNPKKMAVRSDGKPAVTKLKVLEHFGTEATYVEVELITGRTHQIRVHTSYRHHPVYNDTLYGAGEGKVKTQEQVLQSFYLKFTKPFSSQIIELEIPPDEKLSKVLKYYRNRRV
ncbi:MAG TPA: RNA pseudouridine synthase [Cyanobacteria bacterium UBA11991]|nr:RluA family pseudouridine synthase [Cyanobacteriota bacterium]MDY6358204.1 RluA family pseudouridine synthase [Cyanobacteriota bacterium]HCB11417.1 RNA pseudouridine synthase [Cyanobacteria bacterium UBA11991]